MRKRWVWVGVAATALILAFFVFALIPGEPDGLEFIRKHGPRQEFLNATTGHTASRSGPAVPTPLWDRVFVFDSITEALKSDLKAMAGNHFITVGGRMSEDHILVVRLPKNRTAILYLDRNLLTVTAEPTPSWVTQQWTAFKRWTGRQPQKPPQSNNYFSGAKIRIQ